MHCVWGMKIRKPKLVIGARLAWPPIECEHAITLVLKNCLAHPRVEGERSIIIGAHAAAPARTLRADFLSSRSPHKAV